MAAIVGAAITGLAATSTTAIVVGYVVTTALTSVVLSALMPKPKVPTMGTIGSNEANRGYQVSTRGAALDHQIVYGKSKVGGAIVFDAVSGENSKMLHRVVAFTGHEIEEFTTFYLNDEALTVTSAIDSNGQTYYKPTIATAKNGVTSTRYNDYVRIYIRKGGTDNNTPITSLIQSGVGWTQYHKLNGISYAYFRFEFEADTYPNGVPDITAIIKGKKVYDPRSDTVAWSDNPALCIRDYLTSNYGLSEDTDRIDDTAISTAANVCQYYNYPTLNGDPRFTMNGAFTTAVTPHDHIIELLGSMGGSLWYSQGKWRMKAAHYVAPTHEFTLDDVRSSISVATRHSRRDNFNTVKGVFRGPVTHYQPTDYKEVTNSAFVTADGGQVSVYDMNLPFTDNFNMCRRLALIMLERNRQQITVQASFGLKGMKVQAGDIIQLTVPRFGWDQKEFEVVEWTFGLVDDNDLQTQMTLREISANVFDDISDGAFLELDNTTLLSPFDVPSVGITAEGTTRVLAEKVVTELSATITSADDSRVDRVEVQYKLSSESTYLPMGTGSLGRYSVLDLVRADYDIRARAINTFGIKGAWEYTLNFELNPPDPVPADVNNFRYEVSQGTTFLRWDAVPDLDLSYYQVRYNAATSGATWNSSAVAIERVARPSTFATVPTRSGTFLIKAIDKLGQPSENATPLIILATDIPQLGVTDTQTEDPTFAGTNINTIIDTLQTPDELIIDDITAASPTGTYEFSSYIDTSSPRTCRVTGYTTFNRYVGYAAQWDNIPQTWDTWPEGFDTWTEEEADFGDISVVVQVSATSDDPSGTPTWSPYVDAIGQQFVARAFRFRAVLTATNTKVSPSIETLYAEVSY